MTRLYAEDTSVPVARSRGEIDELLKAWGCTKLGWSDEFDERRSQLQFVWLHGGVQYLARFTVPLPKRDDVRQRLKKANRNGWWPSDSATETAMAQGERAAYRVLLLKIKADLNAVAAGIIPAETVFLPWLVGSDGRTVAEAVMPKLATLLNLPADRLLGNGQ